MVVFPFCHAFVTVRLFVHQLGILVLVRALYLPESRALSRMKQCSCPVQAAGVEEQQKINPEFDQFVLKANQVWEKEWPDLCRMYNLLLEFDSPFR